MDEIVILLGLLALVLVLGSILGLVGFGATRRLSREVEDLRRDVASLAARLGEGATMAPHQAVAAPVPMEAPAAAPSPPPAAMPTEQPAAAATAQLSPGRAPAETPPPPVSAPVADLVPDDFPDIPHAPPAKPRRDIEAAIGTRWAVWVGGVALALGAIFLVRYSIEAGLLGPGARILAGLGLSGLLLAGSEWLRRSGTAEAPAAMRGAYVPGVLAAAGTVAAFASAYAAYALYGFMGPTAAFAALALIALGTLALALLHGPSLAALGFLASHVVPVLVSTGNAALGPLSLYLLVLLAASLALGRLRGWRWLAVSATVVTLLWTLPMLLVASRGGLDPAIIAGFVVAAFVLVHLAFVASIHPDDPGLVPASHDHVAALMLGLFALPAVGHLGTFNTDFFGLVLMVGLATASLVTVYAVPAVRHLALAAIALVLLGYTSFDVIFPAMLEPAIDTGQPFDVEAWLASVDTGRLSGGAAVLGLFFAALGLAGTLGSAARIQLALAGSVIPLGLLVLAYMRISLFQPSFAFGAVALVLAAWFAVVVEALGRRLRSGEHGVDGAVAVYAVLAVGALAAGFGMTFERGVLTIALALIVPAIAWVEAARPVAGLRPVALAVAAVVSARFVNDPAVVGTDLGTTPVFNWLLYGYGVPALAFGFAAYRFGRSRMDAYVPFFEALAITFVTLTAVMLIHHAMNGGDLFGAISGLAEQSLITMSLLAVSIGIQWLGTRRRSVVFDKGPLVVGAIGLVSAGVGLVVTSNPVVTFEPIDGGAFDGTLILGYLAPALMAFVVAWLASRRLDRPMWFVGIAGGLGTLLAALWVTLAVRAAWHPGDLSSGLIEEGELYAYSAVWLAFGLVLLGAGFVAGARALRMVAAAVVIGVVVKVFLVDTANLTGALRAISFIGLGAVLVAVGLVYQKLFARRAAGS